MTTRSHASSLQLARETRERFVIATEVVITPVARAIQERLTALAGQTGNAREMQENRDGFLAFRFEWKFALATVLANLHDVVIILGFFAFFQWEFSLAVLAAVLAVLGYSVNESVVIFDRIREAFRRYRKMTTREVIDHAITSTMSRTIITHGSTQMMVLSMLLFGGPTLHYFALALTIGILFGIYSSVFVAAAIAMWLGVKREDLVRASAKDRDPNDPHAGAVV